MFQKILDKWLTVEKPLEDRVFKKPSFILMGIIYLLSLGCFWGLLYGFQEWESILYRISTDPVQYAMSGWAASYFIYFFMMLVPLLVANIVYKKTETPAYPFTVLFGGMCAGALFMLNNLWFGCYMIFVNAMCILVNAVSQKEYKLKIWHHFYYLLLGAIGGIFNSIIQMIFWDVWTFLQFIHLYLFISIIAAVKIRQWGYLYMVGWAISAIIMIFGEGFWIFTVFPPYAKANIMVVAIYNLIVPPILVGSVLTYFFKIQRNVRSRTYNPDEQNVKVGVKGEEVKKENVNKESSTPDQLAKFAKIVSISKKIKLASVALSLKIDEEELMELLISWKSHFSYKIDEKFLVIDDTDDFLKNLSSQFEDWDSQDNEDKI